MGQPLEGVSFIFLAIDKFSINYRDLVIVIGGDGFMLQTLKKNKKSNKFFYVINAGNYDFLMNKF